MPGIRNQVVLRDGKVFRDKVAYTFNTTNSVILILDSGGTKLEWRGLKENGNIQQGREKGFHALITGLNELEGILKSIKGQLTDEVGKVYFYGTGCAASSVCNPVSKCISGFFPGAEISVDTDLLAVARSLCHREAGIACILGTGSNSCHYNGLEIIKNIPPLGYILGDEGSGADLGKHLLRTYIRGGFPDRLAESFHKRYDIDLEKTLSHIYKGGHPNAFLAGFSKFAFDHQRDPVIFKLVYSCFNSFFDNVLLSYSDIKTLPVHFSGSVAFYFNNILRQVGNEHEIKIRNIVESPIAGLTLFHEKEL